MLLITLLLPILLHLGGTGSLQQADSPPPATARAERPLLEEVRADFTVHGEPIHPIILDQFVPPMIGAGPEVLAVDVEAAMHRTAHLPPHVKDQWNPGYLTYRYKDGELHCFASYAIAGTLDDGTIILRSASNYGGTHTTLKLLLVRFDQDRPLSPDGSPLLVLRLVKVLPFARIDADVQIEADAIIVRHTGDDGKGHERRWPVED